LKRSVILFALLFALVASTAGFGAVLWDKMTLDPWAYDSETDDDWGVYSDFDYPGAGTFQLTATTPVVGVEWQGHYYDYSVIDPDNWIIQIWNQDPASAAPLGYPSGAQPIFKQTIAAPAQVPIRMMFQSTEQRYYANLDPPFVPPAAGVYWIQITAQDNWFYMQLASRYLTDLIPPSPPTQAYASGFGYDKPWKTKEYHYWREPYYTNGETGGVWIEGNTLPNVPTVSWYPCLPMLKLDSGQVSAPPVYTVTGTVTDGAAPVAGATVGVASHTQATAQPEFYGYTNGTGQFTIKVTGIGPTCYVAAWADGYSPSADAVVNITTNPNVALAIQATAGNIAVGRPVWSDSVWPDYPAANAVDDDRGTDYSSVPGTPQLGSPPVNFIVDVSDTGAGVAAICFWYESMGYWSFDQPGDYTAYVTKDDPLVWDEGTGDWIPNQAANWTAIFDIHNGPGGMYDPSAFHDAIAVPENLQMGIRGVKVTTRALASGDYNCLDYQELQVFQLSVPASNKLGDVKKMPNGSPVAIARKRATAASGSVSAGIGYIEEPDRSSGIRVDTSAALPTYLGDAVSVSGTVQTTAQGERYIQADSVANVEGRRPLEAVFMTSRAAATAAAQGMFVKMAGEVIAVGANDFTICDNSVGTGADKVCIAPIKVACGILTKPSVGDFVRVRGAVSTDGTSPVLLMRGKQYELLVESKDPGIPTGRHTLPFPGKYLYPRDYLVLGPFPVQGLTTWDQLVFDYISYASGGAVTEETVAPNLGDAVGNYVWKRSLGTGYALDFAELGAGDNVVCYAFYSVWSPEEKVGDMAIGSDDGIAVRVNGVEVWANDVAEGRAVNIGDDLIQWVILNPGWNGILFKVRNGTGPTGLASGLVEQGTYVSPGYGNSGTPIPALGYALSSK